MIAGVLSAFALFADDTGVTVNGVDVGAGSGEGWTYYPETGYVEVTGGGAYVLSGTRTDGKVMFAINDDAEITLSNLCLKCTTPNECCIWATNDVNVTLFLAGTNMLDASANGEGICIENGSDLMIMAKPGLSDEEAVLVVKGGSECAAISTGSTTKEGEAPQLTIAGGTIDATGGSGSAAIGGSYAKRSRACKTKITISGGHVIARSSETAGDGRGAAAIGQRGANFVSDDVSVYITGGYVEAYGGPDSAGIGGGCDSAFNTIKITGGTVYGKRGDYGQ